MPGFGTALGFSSMSYGALLSSLIIIACSLYIDKFYLKFIFQGIFIKTLISVPIIIIIHTLLIIILNNQDINFSRLIFSILLIEVILISIFLLRNFITVINEEDFDFCIKYIFIILIMMGFFGAFGFFSFGRSGKPMGFFNEPSHYALVFLPFFLWILYRDSNIIRKYILLVLVFYIALIIQSLVLLLIVVGAACITMRFKNTVIALSILFIFYTGFNSTSINNKFFKSTSNVVTETTTMNNYIRNRLPLLNIETNVLDKTKVENLDLFDLPSTYLSRLIQDSYNGSLLVMLSGWERAIMNIKDSGGVGFGFQQFGLFGRWGDATFKIVSIYGVPLCLNDGGSLSPKIIGEFGFFGILLIFIYIKFSFLKLKEYRQYCINFTHHGNLKHVFYISCIISFVISVFIRGVGYFTAESFLFILGISGIFLKARVVKS